MTFERFFFVFANLLAWTTKTQFCNHHNRPIPNNVKHPNNLSILCKPRLNNIYIVIIGINIFLVLFYENVFTILLVWLLKDQGCTTSELGLPKPCATLLLERQSLLILQEDMYHRHLHGISEQTQDTIDETIKNLHLCQAKVGDELKRSTRISLTIRNAPKSTKIKLFS